ncbi:MAG: 3-ketoacyl-ACP reductase [Caulobacteraceae bacterium]|nr:3-ketoacyl-ACP reductase [Caulobacteraceae bacterium]
MRSVLITAGGAGIGRAIAEVFAGAGYRTFVCDVSAEACADLKAALPDVVALIADVSKPDQVVAMFAAVEAEAGGLDVLVNNAGVGGPRGPIDEIEPAAWDATIAVNLNGMFYCMKEGARLMKAAGAGTIVNISTSSVLTGLPNRAAYVASKAGVMGLTRNAARELGPFGIRCNAVLPGLIDNPRGRALVQRIASERGQTFDEAEAGFLKYISLRCWIDPADIGQMALFLASAAARHVTGQAIAVDGNVEWEE